jgi:hypothetical protein
LVTIEMLQAELHGHGMPQAIASEDYLTSTVFELLKYLEALDFWQRLTLRADTVTADGTRLRGKLTLHDFGPSDEVEIRFWERYGESIPDLTIRLIRRGIPVLQLLVEVKLKSEKGEAGDVDRDQLVRYAELAATLSTPDVPVLLLFLTQGDPLLDIKESLDLLASKVEPAGRIFGIQWADVHACCVEALNSGALSSIENRIVADLAEYLSARNLDYFTGFRESGLPEINVMCMFAPEARGLFTEVPLPDHNSNSTGTLPGRPRTENASHR